jgi:hypothetical protein
MCEVKRHGFFEHLGADGRLDHRVLYLDGVAVWAGRAANDEPPRELATIDGEARREGRSVREGWVEEPDVAPRASSVFVAGDRRSR